MTLGPRDQKRSARRNGQHLSPEFRAIRDSIDLPRMAEIAVFPAEIPWLMTINSAVKTALIEVWKDERSIQRASGIADAILALWTKRML